MKEMKSKRGLHVKLEYLDYIMPSLGQVVCGNELFNFHKIRRLNVFLGVECNGEVLKAKTET